MGRLRAATAPHPPAGWAGDAGWAVAVGGTVALALVATLALSVQAAFGFVALVLVVALHQHDRRWGLAGLLAFWFGVAGLRRVLGLSTGYVDQDPLSLAPFLATGALAMLELARGPLAADVRRVGLLALAAFALGVPAGLLLGPQAAFFALVAYAAGVSGLVLGAREGENPGTLRAILLYGMVPVAAYAVLQRLLPLPRWDQAWVNASLIDSIGAADDEKVRVFSTLNSPGALAPLLALSLLCCLSVPRMRLPVVLGAAVVALALSFTLVRSAWLALIVAALAHVVASGGRSARPVLGSAAVVVAVTLALAPVNATAREVLDRFSSIGGYQTDTSATARTDTFSATLPEAVGAPLGHGLGTAGEPSKLTAGSQLRAADNGYLSLVYQVGPVGFLLFAAAAAAILRAAWHGARARAPGRELRVLSFAMLVFLVVQLAAGDALYGVTGVIFWFLAGQVLVQDTARRRAAAVSPDPRPA